MKRWIVALLVAAAVFVLVLPGILGHIAERDLEESIEHAQLQSPNVTISTESYDRGWLKSAGRHRIEFSDRDAFPGLARFVDDAGYATMPALVFDSEIHHGLLPMAATGEDGEATADGVVNLVSSIQLDPGNGELIELPGRVFTSIGIDGDARAIIDIDSGEWSEDGNQISWEGADLALAATPSGDLSEAKGFIAPMRFASGRDGVHSERIDIEFEQEESVHGLMVGSLLLKSGAVRAEGSAGPHFGFGSAEIRASNELNDDRINGTSSVDIAEIGVPGVGSMDLGMDVVFEGFKAAPLAKIIEAFEQAADGGDPQAALAAVYPSHDQELQELLGGGGEFRIDRLEVSYPPGTIEANMKLNLPESSSGDAFSWPGLLLKMSASMSVRMPGAVFDMLQASYPDANSAVGMGFLIKDGDDYKMNFQYAQGLATVNGMPMPVPLPGN